MGERVRICMQRRGGGKCEGRCGEREGTGISKLVCTRRERKIKSEKSNFSGSEEGGGRIV